jgi:hypothetical protein
MKGAEERAADLRRLDPVKLDLAIGKGGGIIKIELQLLHAAQIGARLRRQQLRGLAAVWLGQQVEPGT